MKENTLDGNVGMSCSCGGDGGLEQVETELMPEQPRCVIVVSPHARRRRLVCVDRYDRKAVPIGIREAVFDRVGVLDSVHDADQDLAREHSGGDLRTWS